jgi:hypothetical protein
MPAKVSEETMLLRGKKATAATRAQGRAIVRMKENRPEEWKALYAEELAKAKQELGLID